MASSSSRSLGSPGSEEPGKTLNSTLGSLCWALSLAITFNPTFGSFTLLKPLSHLVNPFFWWKCLDCLDETDFFGVQSVDTVGRCTTSYLLAGPVCL